MESVHQLDPKGLDGFHIRSVELYKNQALDPDAIRGLFDAGFMAHHWSFELTTSDSLAAMTGEGRSRLHGCDGDRRRVQSGVRWQQRHRLWQQQCAGHDEQRRRRYAAQLLLVALGLPD